MAYPFPMIAKHLEQSPGVGCLTTQPLRDVVASGTQPIANPEFCRLPKPGTLCPYSGLSRTVLYQLCKSGHVRSKAIRKVGATRGIRIIVFSSLMEYLHSLQDDTFSGGTEPKQILKK